MGHPHRHSFFSAFPASLPHRPTPWHHQSNMRHPIHVHWIGRHYDSGRYRAPVHHRPILLSGIHQDPLQYHPRMVRRGSGRDPDISGCFHRLSPISLILDLLSHLPLYFNI